MRISGAKPHNTITMKTTDKKSAAEMAQWWLARKDREVCNQLIATAAFLKENQQYRQRHTAVYARLYGNQSLFSFIGANISKIDQSANALPLDRPTFNLVQSAVDTLVSKIGQSRPSPVFLTDNGDYKQRNLAKKLNNFILGEFYQTKAYDKASIMLRDCLVTGDGVLHVYRDENNKVGIERVLNTEIFVDPNESIYGEPRQMYRLKLVDRNVLMDRAPKGKKNAVETAEKSFPDNSADSSKTVSDLVMVVEGWRLPSGPGAKDGRHTIACSSGIIFDEEWTKDKFPFVFLKYSPRLLGFWAQGLAEQLMGTQLEINSILYTISKSIRLVGVPRVFVEAGSKIVKAHLNNDVGAIVEYRGTMPEYAVAPCVPAEMYQQLQRLIDYGYRQSGVSSLDAGAQKPAGLNSGEAIRSYDDISNDRFNSLSRKWDNLFVDLAYQVIELAQEIAEETGEYSTVYPNKNGTKQIDLPEANLIQDPFVIQCFNMSSLPRDPAGRKQTVTDMVQSGMITLKEGRRLLEYPDLEQIDKLDNASEERIFQILDKIVEDGEYTPPDPFMDLQLANDTAVKYYNLYAMANLEPEKEQQLRDFYSQVQALKMAAQPPQPSGMPAGAQSAQGGASPQASPEPIPTSPLVPNGVAQ